MKGWSNIENIALYSNFGRYIRGILRFTEEERNGFFVSSEKSSFRVLCVSLWVVFGTLKRMKF